ncbi:hypothetical protein CYMTET_18857, partial [Cymbomonas tetramitiformis]
AVRRAFICPDYLKEVWKAAECDKTWDDLTEDDVLHLAAVHPHGSLSQLYLKNRSAYTIYPTLDSLGGKDIAPLSINSDKLEQGMLAGMRATAEIMEPIIRNIKE